jgi:hypothetical protein
MRTPDPTAHDRGHLPIERIPYSTADNRPKTSPAFSYQSDYGPDDRFAENIDYPPPSTAYYIPETLGSSNAKLIYPPAMVRHAPPEITPDGAQYAAPVVQPPVTGYSSSQFQTTRDRFEDTSFRTPAPSDYTISRDITEGTHKFEIRCRHPDPAHEWDNIPQRETPGPAQYDIQPKERIKSGRIANTGHHAYDEIEDRPLAFRTPHSSMLRKSFNAHYFKAHLR